MKDHLQILSDRHHMGLTESLRLLFEKRLGHELYFQKGLEWYDEGYWDVYGHIDTAKQYLERELEGVNGITLKEFKNTKFDILLCSLPQHVPMWIKLKELYQPQAKLIMQIGNQWAFDTNFPIKNIMASAKIPPLPGFNVIEYHQNFDLDIFHYAPPKAGKKIYSFINCLNTEDLYKEDWELFEKLEQLMPTWEFKSFGGQARDGAIWDRKELADKMRESTLIFQIKRNGDGFGHNIFSAAAVGRPLITRASDYKGKLAEALIDQYTSIMVDNKTPEQIAEEIEATYYLTYESQSVNLHPNLEDMGGNINETFKEAVNFDKEQKDIERFLENLQ